MVEKILNHIYKYYVKYNLKKVKLEFCIEQVYVLLGLKISII